MDLEMNGKLALVTGPGRILFRYECFRLFDDWSVPSGSRPAQSPPAAQHKQ